MPDDCKDLAERKNNIYIKNSMVLETWKMLDSMRAHLKKGNKPRHLFVIGHSGLGKTQSLERYVSMNPGFTIIDKDETEVDIKPVLYIEMPEPFTILEFYQSITASLGAPTLPGRPSIGAVKRQAFCLLEVQKVEMIILDELDNILLSRYVKADEAMNTIKHVSNSANLSIVGVGSPNIEALLELDFSFFRRFPKKEFKAFNNCDEEFCNLLTCIEEQIRPPFYIGLGDTKTKFPKLLYLLSKGFVGILTPLIIEAYRELGVFDDNFKDINKAKLNVDSIDQAYITIVGDVDLEKFDTMLNKKQKVLLHKSYL